MEETGGGAPTDRTGAAKPADRTWSSVAIPHHFQETEYTCGAASLRMVLEAVAGVALEENDLAQALRSNEQIGTRQRRLRQFMTDLGLNVQEFDTDTRLDTIRNCMASGRVVLILYHLQVEATDHYAVVLRIGPRRILLQDPWTGPATEMDLDAFDAAWRTKDGVAGRRSRWMLAVAAQAPLP